MENSINTPAKPATPSVTPAKRKVESYDISRSDETLQLASDVARFIRENKLFMNIQGKEYVNVEGWQYAGSRLGILPIVQDLINQSDANEVKYKAEVRLLNLRTEQFVGAGFAICSNKEPGKKFFQEFAIASMAQTRAIGKAYRNILAWLIRAAGYEPTPAEEMEAVVVPPSTPTDTPPQPVKVVPARPEDNNNPSGSQSPVPMATTRQKAEILLLLNSEYVGQEEREKMIGGINKLDRDRADKAIEKLKKTLTQRHDEATSASAAMNAIRTSDPINTVQKAELHKLLRDRTITQDEANVVFDAIPTMNWEKANETIKQVKATIAERQKGGVTA